ncbi:MAG: Isopenicillin N epimerase [Anaerolineales bacterium]|nr:Isopenicillin N epimerase [Anaerolineales bacterium]
MTNPLRNEFLLDPAVHFLNHGSFGATPRAVFEKYQQWQKRLELQPVLFLDREIDSLLKESRAALGKFIHADAEDLVYIPNATHGVNIVAHSFPLQPGDEVLASDHEYGACNYAWEYLCERAGAKYIRQPISLPVKTNEEIVEAFWQGVTPRTKIIFISHITSVTALRLPVEKICKRARAAGILTVIDAAHSPGQIPLDLAALNADIVFGNCHKWMMAPKGAGFLHVRRELQARIEPFVVSWGARATAETTTGSRFIDILQWTGTHDPASALTVPAAIRFMLDHDWDSVRQSCHALLRETLQRICALTDLPPAYPLDSDFYAQMGIAPLPRVDAARLKQMLYDQFNIEVPITLWRDRFFVRVSIQGYNTRADADALVNGLHELLPRLAV